MLYILSSVCPSICSVPSLLMNNVSGRSEILLGRFLLIINGRSVNSSMLSALEDVTETLECNDSET